MRDMSRPSSGGRKGSSVLFDTAGGTTAVREHDKAAYITLLESQLERVTATSLSVDSLTSRVSALQSEVEQSSERLHQLTRLLKLEQAYSAKVKEELTQRLLDVEATLQQCRDEHSHDRDEQRRQRDERDEMERRERAERQQREAQMQAVLADVDERLGTLQRQADDEQRQRQQDRRDWHDSRQHIDERLSTLTQRTDDTAARTESVVRMLALLEERNRADVDRRKQDEQQWQLDMMAAKEQQRTQLLKCVSDLRAFQLSIRDEMGRRERQVEVMKKAVLMMSEEMDRGGSSGGGGGPAADEVRRWREDERRQREERERRRQREELDKMRDDMYRYIDARISSLPPPPAPPPPAPYTRPTSGYDRELRTERPRGVDDVRWVERSMEQLVNELTTERERERGKHTTAAFAERGGYREATHGRPAATAAARGAYRTSAAGGCANAPLSGRQRGGIRDTARPKRASIGR